MIEEAELSFRPCAVEDAELIFAWRQEGTTTRYNPLDPLTLVQLKEILRNAKTDFSNLALDPQRWLVLKDGTPIGTATLKHINYRMGYAEIGYAISEAHQARGIGTAAVGLFVKKVFRETSLRRLIAHVSTENQASWKLLERLGFKREGTLRQHYCIEGRFHDEYVYGLLRSEA